MSIKDRFLSLGMTVLLGFGLFACGNNEKSGAPEGSKEAGTSQEVGTSEESVNMTASYEKARGEFKSLTGIELPAVADLEVDEYPYTEGVTTDYCFDITGGSALNFTTYMVFEDFFKEELGDCSENYPSGNEEEGRDAQWMKEGRWYQTYWDATNHAIYINTYIPG